jgi:hypothetical protein
MLVRVYCGGMLVDGDTFSPAHILPPPHPLLASLQAPHWVPPLMFPPSPWRCIASSSGRHSC